MIKNNELNMKICDCEEGASNTQTWYEFIRESEEEFGMEQADVYNMDNEGLNEYIEFLDMLWEK